MPGLRPEEAAALDGHRAFLTRPDAGSRTLRPGETTRLCGVSITLIAAERATYAAGGCGNCVGLGVRLRVVPTGLLGRWRAVELAIGPAPEIARACGVAIAVVEAVDGGEGGGPVRVIVAGER